MELLCPSCQRRLTIPDQYAGQQMKCPLCNNTFTAPALSASPGTGAPPAPIPFLPEAPPPPPLPTAPPPTSAPPLPTDGRVSAPAPPPAPEKPPPPPGEYVHRRSVSFSPRVLQWVVPGALLLALVLTFFPWVDLQRGGVVMASQNAWEAAIGHVDEDPYWKNSDKMDPYRAAVELTTASWPVILYLLALLLALLLAVAAVVLPRLRLNLPPAVQQMMPLRWMLTAAAVLLVLVFLVLQLLFGFSLENHVRDAVNLRFESNLNAARGAANQDALRTEALATRGAELAALERTRPLTLVAICDVVALVCVGLIVWIDLRKDRPLPRVELMW